MMSVTWQALTQAPNLFDASAELQFPPSLRPHGLGDLKHFRINQEAGTVEVHPLLGESTPIWGYRGEYTGPTVEVDGGDRVLVTYANHIEGDLPYAHVVADTSATPPGSMNDPGTEQASQDPLDDQESAAVAALNAWTVVHLHGAPTQPDSDGWTESVLGVGEDVVMGYEFPRETCTMAHPPAQPGGDTVVEDYPGGAAPLFWYHDHAMGVTRFNVFAGLAGAWLVRDPVEKEIGLPRGKYELPLVLQDRNFATEGGALTDPLTGAFLHKVDTDTRECFPPANLVNGKLWPRARVRPRVYRLRLVNGANARTYRLHFMGLASTDEATRAPLTGDHVQQIGTDGGLVGRAADLPQGGLTLAPGERADVLIDFGKIALDGYAHVVVYNSASAPFQGAPLGPPEDVYTGNRGEFREFPQVMRFDLTGGAAHPGLGGQPIRGMTLDPDFKRLPTDHDQYPSDHGHTLVVLREEDTPGTPTSPSPSPMLFLHEMMAEADADQRGTNLFKVIDPVTGAPQGIRLTLPDDPTTYVTVAKRFHDTTSVFIEKDSWRLWKILNLSPDTHPFHLHLVQFQAIARKWYAVPGGSAPLAKGETNITFTVPPDAQSLDANETGWKDTIRVNPGERSSANGDDAIVSAEMVIVAAQFRRHAGRYMYHCHILEHEDMEMMRPYVVTPRDTMPFMKNMGSSMNMGSGPVPPPTPPAGGGTDMPMGSH